LPQRADPLHLTVCQAVRQLGVRNHTFVTCTQNIAEFWNLCTRPAAARGGLGLSLDETSRRLAVLERFVTVLREPPTAYDKWKNLVARHRVQGKQVHDARIVALISAHRIRRILTLNPDDFARYSGLQVFTPQQTLKAATS
jgi:predicted nucleic acid-binding protein